MIPSLRPRRAASSCALLFGLSLGLVGPAGAQDAAQPADGETGATSASAGTGSYFSRFEGAWEGSGMAQVEQLPEPLNVSCEMAGQSDEETAFSIEGECSALFVMTKELGADIQRDPETGAYTGVYRGSESGPADLAGTREGDTLTFDVTWGRKIYDDDTAVMTITNTGDGTFTMQVRELIDGETVTVSDLAFERVEAEPADASADGSGEG